MPTEILPVNRFNSYCELDIQLSHSIIYTFDRYDKQLISGDHVYAQSSLYYSMNLNEKFKQQ